MFVFVDLDDRSFDLVQAHDCSRLHVLVAGERDLDRLADTLAETARVEPDDHAWIRIDSIRRMARLCVDEGWDDQFGEMVRFASDRGWVDAGGEHLRAHVEWSGS